MITTQRRSSATSVSVAVTDEQFIAMVDDGMSINAISKKLRTGPHAVVNRAIRLGLEDDLTDGPDEAVISRRRAIAACAAELDALNAAHPGEAYRDLGARRVLPPTNPPILRYAA